MSPQSVTTSNHAERPCCRWSRLKLSVRNSALVGRTRIGLSAERTPVAESEGSVHFSKTFVIRECITHTISRRSPKSACGSFGTRELFRSRFLSRRLGNVAGALCLRVAARGSHCYRDVEWSKPDSHHYIAWQLTTRRCLSQRGPHRGCPAARPCKLRAVMTPYQKRRCGNASVSGTRVARS